MWWRGNWVGEEGRADTRKWASGRFNSFSISMHICISLSPSRKKIQNKKGMAAVWWPQWVAACVAFFAPVMSLFDDAHTHTRAFFYSRVPPAYLQSVEKRRNKRRRRRKKPIISPLFFFLPCVIFYLELCSPHARPPSSFLLLSTSQFFFSSFFFSFFLSLIFVAGLWKTKGGKLRNLRGNHRNRVRGKIRGGTHTLD